jgi:hypothetical protein
MKLADFQAAFDRMLQAQEAFRTKWLPKVDEIEEIQPFVEDGGMRIGRVRFSHWDLVGDHIFGNWHPTLARFGFIPLMSKVDVIDGSIEMWLAGSQFDLVPEGRIVPMYRAVCQIDNDTREVVHIHFERVGDGCLQEIPPSPNQYELVRR